MKILIFGSTGLVGTAIVKAFSNSEFKILKPNRDEVNLFSYSETSNYIKNNKPEIIINSAAKVGGILANNIKRTAFLTENIKINLNILESCIGFPKIKIINLGSSCIYPLNVKNPISENEILNGKLEETNSPYAMAKLTAIELGNAMKKEFGHKVVNLMPTNLYGINDNFSETESHVIPGLIARMHKSKIQKIPKFHIWGSGLPLREFLYSDDLAQAIKFIIENEIEDEIINIGSGKEISIKDLAYLIKKIIKYEGDLDFDSSKPDGNPRKLLDSRLISSYGWSPTVSLEEGLKLTYDWYLNKFNLDFPK